MTLPNFIILGAQRSGTSSLHHYLKQHPQIYMCARKEPRFFAFLEEEPHFHGSCDCEAAVVRYQTLCNKSIANINEYCALFQGMANQKAIGEVSPIYLYSPRAPERIKKLYPL